MDPMFDAPRLAIAFDASRVTGILLERGRPVAHAEAALARGALVPRPLEENLVRPADVRDALAQVMRELGKSGAVALVLPDGIARFALLDLPEGVAALDAARFRLGTALPFPVSEAAVDGVVAGPRRFLAAAVRRLVVRGYEAVAAEAGLRQERVDLAPLVSLSPLLAESGPIVAAHLGDAAFSVAVLRDGKVLSFRNRRRDPESDEYQRLRDEFLRSAALQAIERPRIVVLGADAPELVAALRNEGHQAEVGGKRSGSEPASAGWLAAVS
jgi:hypothetical protein